MNAKRTIAIVLAGGALAAWLSAAMTPSEPPAGLVSSEKPAIDADGANLAQEIARLHDRLRPDATPRQLTRNLFEFHAAPAAPLPSLKRVAPEAAAPPVASAPVLTLEGIAEDGSGDGIVRTAVVASGGQLFLAKEGDSVTPRYRVTRISIDVVELQDVTDGSVRRLALK
jgi:hypothetical protein